VIPVVVLRAVSHRLPRGIKFDERQMAVRVRIAVTIELGDGDGLNDGVSLLSAQVEIRVRFFAIQSMKQFPGGIPEPEEWFSVHRLQVALISADFQTCQCLGERRGQAAQPSQGYERD
jgi:hypothetical protein